MSPISRLMPLVMIIALAATSTSAQVQTGTPPFGSFGGGPDVINLANLNVHWTIPVFHKAGRGTNFSYDLSYDSSVWYPVTSSGTTSWQSVANFGWMGMTQVPLGYISNSQTSFLCGNPRFPTGVKILYTNWVYHDPFGISHAFSGSTWYVSNPTGCGASTTSLTSVAADGSGYTLQATGGASNVISAAGKVVQPQAGTATGVATDRNG